jgi:hypothetical protein
MRRPYKITASLLVLFALATGAWMMFGPAACQTSPPRLVGTLMPAPHRSQRLVALASKEATSIKDVDARLTRQLNLAHLQIERGWADDARVSLAATSATLPSKDADGLKSHARISGWISISELSRRIKDTATATAACDGAIAAMNAIEVPGRRCEYVMGIANELQYLRGLPAAADLVAKAGPWTKSIDDLPQRRQAVMSFACALFNLDSFDAGLAMLQNEGDAAWRSDTLKQLALLPGPASESSTMAARESKTQQPAPYYGRQLNYDQIFRGQEKSATKGD